jgi:hypothetical protein
MSEGMTGNVNGEVLIDTYVAKTNIFMAWYLIKQEIGLHGVVLI